MGTPGSGPGSPLRDNLGVRAFLEGDVAILAQTASDMRLPRKEHAGGARHGGELSGQVVPRRGETRRG